MNKSNFLKKILGSLPRCFVTIDRDFKILETSYGVERFAETAAMIFRDSDIRHAFPELIGLESAFTEIWNDSGQTLELKGIMRGRGDEVPIYFDLYAVLSEEEYWSASWRHSGGIIADMRQQGDYIDWYCSGMGGLNADYDPDGGETFEEWQARTKYVSEGVVTEEIETDLNKLGWLPSPWPEDDI